MKNLIQIKKTSVKFKRKKKTNNKINVDFNIEIDEESIKIRDVKNKILNVDIKKKKNLLQ